ncbi:hypothetical protein [Candidatus Borrarchaeum sp.]|uniref:hypothetical protein n=1 Tax=Candidatus Borrarchaeum sp. TaxID=2846742 RepID=UPI00257FD5CE|nr:hypothetical protein [Candidatus Borrarchaeum sp.]
MLFRKNLSRLVAKLSTLRKQQVIWLFLLPWFIYTVLAFLEIFMAMSVIPPFADYTASDEIDSYFLTKTIVENYSFAITPYAENVLLVEPLDLIVLNGNVYIRYLPGLAFFGIPFYILGTLIARLLNLEGVLLERVLFFFVCQVNVLSASYTVLLIYKLCKFLGASEKASFLSSYVFAFATVNLVYARSFFDHSLGTMLVFYSFYEVLKIIKGRKNTNRQFIFPGLLLGYSTIVRYSNTFILFPMLLVFLLNKKLSKFSLFLAGFCTMIPVHMLYNFILFGNPFTTIYTYAGPWITTFSVAMSTGEPTYPSYVYLWWQLKQSYSGLHIFVGLFILLFSPFRGLFFYSPVLIFSLLGIYRTIKQKGFDISFFSLTSFILVAVIYAYILPIGEWEWSTRYLNEMIPLLVIHISIVIDTNKTRISKIIFNILFFWSTFVMVLGIYPKFWLNAVPLFRAIEFLFENGFYRILVIAIFSIILVCFVYTRAYISLKEKTRLTSF